VTPSFIEPPPQRETGAGCFAKGCTILCLFCLLLATAFVVGSIYAVRQLRTNFFARQSVPLPVSNSTPEEQHTALAKWKIFERSARAHAPAQIEMTADELNALIAADPRLRGKGFVTIDGNRGHLQVSFAIQSRWLRGRYLNAECTIEAPTTGNPDDLRIIDATINGQPVPDEFLRFRGPFTIRRCLEEWDQENDLKSIDIHGGKVILETRGSG
jgi:hypothetical protein